MPALLPPVPTGDAVDDVAYLARIGFSGVPTPTRATLAALQLVHLRAVPFENLDIARGVPIRLDEAALLTKIIGRPGRGPGGGRERGRGRGGICYELNGAFAGLLRRLGFAVSLLAATFPRPEGITAPDFDHLTLLVTSPLDAGAWLVDVGAGRGAPAGPIGWRWDELQDDPVTDTRFRLTPAVDDGPDRIRLQRQELAPGAAWDDFYWIDPTPRRLHEFAPGLAYHRTSPDSPFTQGTICSRLTTTGRVTLADRHLIMTRTRPGVREERTLTAEAEIAAVLHQEFGIAL